MLDGVLMTAAASVGVLLTFCRLILATKSLPYGTFSLYSRTGPEKDAPLALEGPEGSGGWAGTNCQESVVVQFLAYHVFPQSTAVFSNFTAGPGALNLGPDHRRKMDATLAVPWTRPSDGASGVRLAFVNYHGARHHGDGDHLPRCPKKMTTTTTLQPKPRPTLESILRDRMKAETRRGVEPGRDPDDYLMERLAAHMSECAAKAGLVLHFTYTVLHQCELFCTGALASFDPKERLGDEASSLDPEDAALGLRKLMRKRHPDKVVFGPLGPKVFTQEKLMKRILEGRPNADGNRHGGFILLRGGVQKGELSPENNQGWCLQRTWTDASEVGSFTKYQASVMCGGDPVAGEKLVAKYARGTQQTVARFSYHDRGELVGLDLARFLILRKGLEGFRVEHFIHYTHSRALNPFLEELLQKRHEHKKNGGPDLMIEALKLVLNRYVIRPDDVAGVVHQRRLLFFSVYGNAAMASTNFTSTVVTSGRNMRNRKRLHDADVTELTLLGGLVKKHEPSDLLYAVTRSRPKARIYNILSMSASILSNSRAVYFTLLSDLLDLLSCERVQLAYCVRIQIVGPVVAAADCTFLSIHRTRTVRSWFRTAKIWRTACETQPTSSGSAVYSRRSGPTDIKR